MLRGWVLVAVVVAVLGSSLSGFAADEKKKKRDPEAVFKKRDKDNDGFLTVEEFLGKAEGERAEKMKKFFKRLDKDSDNKVSLEEFKAMGKKRKKETDS